jgi:hypothetical protein
VKYFCTVPVLVAVWSEAWICSHSLAGIAGSNPAGRHGFLSVVGVVCYQLEVSVLGRSPVQRSRTECSVSEYDCEASIMRKPWPIRDCCTMTKKFCTVLMFIPTCVQFKDLMFKSSLQHRNVNILFFKGLQKLLLINLKHSLIQVTH